MSSVKSKNKRHTTELKERKIKENKHKKDITTELKEKRKKKRKKDRKKEIKRKERMMS